MPLYRSMLECGDCRAVQFNGARSRVFLDARSQTCISLRRSCLTTHRQPPAAPTVRKPLCLCCALSRCRRTWRGPWAWCCMNTQTARSAPPAWRWVRVARQWHAQVLLARPAGLAAARLGCWECGWCGGMSAGQVPGPEAPLVAAAAACASHIRRRTRTN